MTAVYVVSSDPVRRRAIAAALRADANPPRIKLLGRLPESEKRQIGWIVVIDIRDTIERDLPSPESLVRLGKAVVLTQAEQATPVTWAPYLAQGDIEFLIAPSHAAVDARQLRAIVSGLLDRTTEELVAGTMRRAGPAFATLRDVVGALLREPWGVRRPRHLAHRLGMGLPELKRRCQPTGLARLEHVLTMIRWSAYEFLTLDGHERPARALATVGVRNRSNFRRQVRRALSAARPQ